MLHSITRSYSQLVTTYGKKLLLNNKNQCCNNANFTRSISSLLIPNIHSIKQRSIVNSTQHIRKFPNGTFANGRFFATGLKSWTKEEIPNPTVEASATDGNGPSFVSNPNAILSNFEVKKLDRLISTLQMETSTDSSHGTQVGVAIIQSMNTDDTTEAAKEYATYLHDTWGIGNYKTNNGGMIFVSIEDRVVYISTGKGLKEVVSDDTIQFIIHRMKPFLKNKQYFDALESAVDDIGRVSIDKEERNRYHEEGKKYKANDNGKHSFGNAWSKLIQMFFILLAIMVVIQAPQEKNIEEANNALKQLEQERAYAIDNGFSVTTCPICSESFVSEEQHKDPVELPCHHQFCDTCIKQWYELNDTCPICHETFEYPVVSKEKVTPTIEEKEQALTSHLIYRMDTIRHKFPGYVSDSTYEEFKKSPLKAKVPTHESFLKAQKSYSSKTETTKSFGGGSSVGGGGGGGSW